MSTRTPKLAATAAAAFVLSMPLPIAAEQPLTLKDVMQALNTNMQEATHGIIMEDYDLIAKSARSIAEHPTPDATVLKKVVAHLGEDMPKFKGFDQQVHDTALELEKAAMEQNKEAVFNHHNQIIRGCVGCHQAYRDSVSSVLND